MVCNKCGAQVPEGSIFCTNCGSIVELDNQTTSEINQNDEVKQEFTPQNNFQNVNQSNSQMNMNFGADSNAGQNYNYSAPVYGGSNSASEKPRKTINTKVIVIIAAAIIVIGIAALIAIPIISKSNEAKAVKNIEGVKLYIPSTFVSNNDGQYDASYGESDDSVMVAVKTFDSSVYSASSYSKIFVNMMKQKGYSCDAASSKSINKNKWQYTKCEYLGAKMYIYIASKDQKLYFVLAGATKQSGDKGTKYIEKVEKYLDFADKGEI